MILHWKKSPETDDWAVFSEEGLQPFEADNEQPNCVYLIWSDSERKMVYVGSGRVERLWDHLNPSDPAYDRIHRHVNLKATYALIDEKDMLGAEHYLAQVYEPSATERTPDEEFVEVSLPNIDVSYHSDRAKETTNNVRAMRSLCDHMKDKLENR